MARFTPHTDNEVREMLDAIGIEAMGELFADIPEGLKAKSFNLPEGTTENETLARMNDIAGRNRVDRLSFIGGGYYDHFIPSAVQAVSSRSEFVTAYTPYQAEASQGTLSAIFEYQTMIAGITGMAYANASLYDGGTALYEAVVMVLRATNRRKIIVDAGVNPLYLKIIITHLVNIDAEIVVADLADIYPDRSRIQSLIDDDTAALVVQNPNFFGVVEDYEDLFEHAHSRGAAGIVAFYPTSLGIIKTPGEMKADIAVAEGQCLGLPLSFGGPYLGLMAVGKNYVRKMPGRIVGETIDRNGKRAYVLTLQAREQHIRREKATSNICSNQALCALRAVIYLSLIGKEGFRNTALINLERSEYMKRALREIPGVEIKEGPTFNEFTIALPVKAEDVSRRMLAEGYAAGIPASLFYKKMENYFIIAVTEKRRETDIDGFVAALRKVLS